MNRSVRFPSGFCFFYISFILQNSSSEMNTKVIFKENRNQNGSLFIFPLLFHSRTEILFDLPFGLFCILELFWNLEFSESGKHLGWDLICIPHMVFKNSSSETEHQEHPQLGPFKMVRSFVSPWCFCSRTGIFGGGFPISGK